MTIDTALVGKNPETAGKRMHHPLTYNDDFLSALTEAHPVVEIDLPYMQGDARFVQRHGTPLQIRVLTDFPFDTYARNSLYEDIREIVWNANEFGSWLGLAFEEHLNYGANALISMERARDERFPRKQMGFRSGLHGLLAHGLIISPNLECESTFQGTEFENRMIIAPTEKLVEYLTELAHVTED